jgi:hypothetical protein
MERDKGREEIKERKKWNKGRKNERKHSPLDLSEVLKC